MYINTEICSVLIFIISFYFALKSYNKLDGTNRWNSEWSITLFVISIGTLIIFILEMFEVIKMD